MTKYLCYGDTIMLNFTKKVFRSDIADQTNPDRQSAWDGESIDEKEQLLMDDQDRKENIKLQKLIESPAYVYKGMVYSDGILEKSLNVIPKDSLDDTKNAKCQFMKCLFRVEIFDNCTFHMLHRKQVFKLDELKKHRE